MQKDKIIQVVTRGQNSLGDCYENGQGVEKDLIKAVKYYQMSADQGNVKGQNNLGRYYENGQGVEKNYQLAVKYYQMSADQGNADAQNRLGDCYENGQGVEKKLLAGCQILLNECQLRKFMGIKQFR
eukprot:TRINITY_DN1225_c0_g1_i6.p2 TRINITY_DN1225_c0_g1~~TRINITY_DN1225_c0_g1_i6.p2  ORF type:complete len:127 (-),score=25.25 TRINITY_DN1225_c0_g1_i6:201-581(-)